MRLLEAPELAQSQGQRVRRTALFCAGALATGTVAGAVPTSAVAHPVVQDKLAPSYDDPLRPLTPSVPYVAPYMPTVPLLTEPLDGLACFPWASSGPVRTERLT